MNTQNGEKTLCAVICRIPLMNTQGNQITMTYFVTVPFSGTITHPQDTSVLPFHGHLHLRLHVEHSLAIILTQLFHLELIEDGGGRAGENKSLDYLPLHYLACALIFCCSVQDVLHKSWSGRKDRTCTLLMHNTYQALDT